MSHSSRQCQAAIRQMERRNRLLDRGDFFGALGVRPWPVQVRVQEEIDLSLIQTPAILADGARMWKF